uniref:Uncharacterized protein n=1 Tax=Octopus bimaculoides TaxID=37653 RepID=A0A0L8HZ84_OCTBM
MFICEWTADSERASKLRNISKTVLTTFNQQGPFSNGRGVLYQFLLHFLFSCQYK